MAGKRKNYGADFKAKMALEAIRSELAVAGLVAEHGVHRTLINTSPTFGSFLSVLTIYVDPASALTTNLAWKTTVKARVKDYAAHDVGVPTHGPSVPCSPDLRL